jgi:hypothetical protein
MEEWTIDKSLGKCFGTGKDIEAGQEYFSALVQTSEGLQRRDFSVEYWQEHKPEVFCFWKTRQSRPDEKKRVFIDDEMLMAFFERLANETDVEKVNFRFVLALVLMRKRKLKYDSSKNQDGKDSWRLRIVGTDTFVEVIDPHLDEQQIEQLTSQLGQILQADL